ncbi:amino acid permease [Lapidilactobacillus bayanensis]|uniref:amino acid permease n=1 Tax=Lapidilactobacillus bayanensis TaxID=2485998 RepID=UPI000F7B656A|nr:amino acid permease [Lapidilactobacillus bayanensis]
MKREPNIQLARNLKNRHVQLIAIGGTIGTGLFLGAGQSIHLAGPAILLAYLVTGIICFILMRALGDLLLSNLNHRSFIDFIRDYLGPTAGFVAGWTYWVCWLAIAMSEVTAIGLYVRFWLQNVPQWLPGLIVLVILLALNSITVALFGETEFWFSMIKIVAIVALIAIGAVLIATHYQTPVGHASLTNLVNYGGFFPTGWHGFLLAFQMVVFSFVGIEMVGLTASETQDPKTVIPKAINEIPLRVILFYLGALFVIMCIYPWSKINPNASPFVTVFSSIGIKSAASIINFVVLTAAASACNSALFSAGRILFSLTLHHSNHQLRKLGKLSKTQVPAPALVFSGLIIAIAVLLNLVIPDDVFTLVSSVATTCFLFIWGAIIVAHLRYRKTAAGQVSKFKVPGAPFTDYLVLAFLTFVVIVLLMNHSTLIALVVAVIWIVLLAVLGKWSQQQAHH